MSNAVTVARSLVLTDDTADRTTVSATLGLFGAAALRYAFDAGVRVMPLKTGESYRSASAALARLGIDVDSWPAPPAGLFVVEERMVYLRSRSPMTVAHEFGHALDCALGGGIYRSGIDPELRRLFEDARAFVTPYAATAIDEYFAESLRAYVEANDATSHWPRATKTRLQRVDPKLFELIDNLFRREFRDAA
ncbi:MAG: hypothetical protein M3R51_07040 [Candidatus Eremiobacteraeota bacterium]|nr:hypothetical protein [Candidatus Eremiobacteraeota bacterium]